MRVTGYFYRNNLCRRYKISLVDIGVDTPWWGIRRWTTYDEGIRHVLDSLLGVELNEEECKKHLGKDSGWFNPTPEWDQKRSHDRLWS
jgi:hypothetical protein